MDHQPTPMESAAATPMRVFHVPPGATVPADCPFRSLIDLWHHRRGDADMPEWEAFDFCDFRGWHSHLVVSAFTDDGEDLTFRIVGEEWKYIYCGDMTGRRFSEIKPRMFHRQLKGHYQRLRSQGGFGYVDGHPPIEGREHQRIAAVQLPFRRNRSAGANGMIHALHRIS